jgi:hypothetical protein
VADTVTGKTACACGMAWIGTIDHGMAEQRDHAMFRASGGEKGPAHDPGLATFTPNKPALAATPAPHQHYTDACDECDAIYTMGREDRSTLGALAATPAPLDVHRYIPDAMAMGDCKVCGHVYGYDLHTPAPLDPHRGETAWTRGHGLSDYCRVHGDIDRHTSVRQHILDQHPGIDYERHLETAIANATPAPLDVLPIGAETWRCPGCRDTTAPEGMCQRCGVFGEMETSAPLDESAYRCGGDCACGCHDTFGQPARFVRSEKKP